MLYFITEGGEDFKIRDELVPCDRPPPRSKASAEARRMWCDLRDAVEYLWGV